MIENNCNRSCLKATAMKKDGAKAPKAPDAHVLGFSPILLHNCWLQPTEKKKAPDAPVLGFSPILPYNCWLQPTETPDAETPDAPALGFSPILLYNCWLQPTWFQPTKTKRACHT
ncbi:MAG: hypothetical protein LBS42_11955 [Tannerella sp.]|jgi:hypothetical protein|nr:hypothetical protein [Tannerella sp.]